MTAPDAREALRALARREVEAAETHWRSMDDGALSLNVLLDIIVNRFAAALATPPPVAPRNEVYEAWQRVFTHDIARLNESIASLRTENVALRKALGLTYEVFVAAPPPMATAPDSTWECDHVGCSNGCTTRTGVCIPCLKARLGTSAASSASEVDQDALATFAATITICSYCRRMGEGQFICNRHTDALAARPGPAEGSA